MHTTPVRPANGRRTGVTLGNFDGVHRGLRPLDNTTLEFSAERGRDSVAATFCPHPRALFSGQCMPPLADLQTRRRLLGAAGISYLLELSFSRQMAAMSPEDFVAAYLLPLDMDSLVIGYDFCLGKGRSGDYQALAEIGARCGFSVTRVPPLMLGNAPISSTRVRRAIEEGDMTAARLMLGRPHGFSGIVTHGQGRGTGLGFPTANLLPPETLLPPDGVYATRLIHKGTACPAVSNIGFSPTFGGTQRTIESFVLDTDINLYEEGVELEFLERLRDERRFPSPKELIEQIGRDVERARACNATLF